MQDSILCHKSNPFNNASLKLHNEYVRSNLIVLINLKSDSINSVI